MNPPAWIRSDHIVLNQQELASCRDAIRWIAPTEASSAEKLRQNIFQNLPSSVEHSCAGTKIRYGPLSPGCAECVAGTWSCLFVNGTCSAGCFFCPSRQSQDDAPTTNGLIFNTPDDYGDYLERFGFTGASLSGGEPLETAERTLAFLSHIKKRFGSRLHVWLYTNGLRADADMLGRLRDAGLDEIRINLHACGYRLDVAERAARAIPVVTIEVPAVPEEEERFRTLLPRLAELGVAFLNLHDIRCTPDNIRRLVLRGYTLRHGLKATVLEAELAALRLLECASQAQLPMAVQYCCFPYKHAYQTRAYRQRWGALVRRPGEEMTKTGALRSLSRKRDHAVVSYSAPRLLARPTYRRAMTQIDVSRTMRAVIERHVLLEKRTISGTNLDAFLEVLEGKSPNESISHDLRDLLCFERMPTGLPDYY